MRLSNHQINRSLSCKIPSRLEPIDEVCGKIRAILAAKSLGTLFFPVELVARECLNNAIIHGNQYDVRKEASLDLQIGRKWVRIQITDEGAGFIRPKKIASISQDNGAASGRGLSICALYADRMAFNRKGNRITLWIRKRRTAMSDYNVEENEHRSVVKLKGDLTAALVPDLQTSFKMLLDKGTDELVIDLDQTAMLDSSGIGLLIAASNSLSAKNGRICVINVCDDIRQLLQSMRLTDRLNVSGPAV